MVCKEFNSFIFIIKISNVIIYAAHRNQKWFHVGVPFDLQFLTFNICYKKLNLGVSLTVENIIKGVSMGRNKGIIDINENFKMRDLRDYDLSEINMVGANMAFADLTGVNLKNRDLTDISLMFATLWQTDFTGAELISANISFADAWKAFFLEARLMDANLKDFHGRGCIFRNAVCRGANFQSAQLWQADFRGADLTDCNFTEANLRDARFDEKTILEGAVFKGVNVEYLPAQLKAQGLRVVRKAR